MPKKEVYSINNTDTINKRDAVIDDDHHESNSYKEYWDYFMQTYNATPSDNTIKNPCSNVNKRKSINRNKSIKEKKIKTQWATPPFNAKIKSASVNDETNSMSSPQIRSTSTSAGLTSSLSSSSHQLPRYLSKRSSFNGDSHYDSKSNIEESTHSPEWTFNCALNVERVLFTPERFEEVKQEEEYHECVQSNVRTSENEESHFEEEWEKQQHQEEEYFLRQNESDELGPCMNYQKSEQDIHKNEDVLGALQLESLSKEYGKYIIYEESLHDKQVKNTCLNSICVDKIDIVYENLVCIELSSDDESDNERLDRSENNVKQNETDNDSPTIGSNKETNNVYKNSTTKKLLEEEEWRHAISQRVKICDANVMRPVKDNEESIFKVDPNITQFYTARLTAAEQCNREILEFLSWSEERHKVKLKAVRELQDNFLNLSACIDKSTILQRNTQTTQNQNSSIVNNSIESCALQLRSAYAHSHRTLLEQTLCAEKEQHLETEAVQREREEGEYEDMNGSIDRMTKTTLPYVYIAEPKNNYNNVTAVANIHSKNERSKMYWERAKLMSNKINNSINNKKANVVSANSKICPLPYYLHPSAPPSRFIHWIANEVDCYETLVFDNGYRELFSLDTTNTYR